MPVLLFSLRNVPEDEVEEIRQLLASNHVAFYETPAGKWGISAPAIWLPDEKELQTAKALIQAYQEARFVRQRDAYESRKREGTNRTIVDAVKEDPLRFVLYLAIVVVVLYFSIKPFFDFGN